MPVLLRNRRVMAAKIETTAGTAETLAAGDGAFDAMNVTFNPDIAENRRMQQGSLSNQASTFGAYGGTATFEIEAHTDGSGGAPAWAEALLPACGMSQAVEVFSFESVPLGAAGSARKTVTLGLYEGGRYKSLAGAMGSVEIRCSVGQPIIFAFTFTGIWQTPTDETVIAPTYPTIAPIRFVGATLTLGGNSLTVSSLSLNFNNEVTLREDATKSAGYAYAEITDRNPTGEMDPEAALVATEDLYGDWIDGTESALALTVGAADNQMIWSAPACQRINVQDADRGNIIVDALSFRLNTNDAAGDSEFDLEWS